MSDYDMNKIVQTDQISHWPDVIAYLLYLECSSHLPSWYMNSGYPILIK